MPIKKLKNLFVIVGPTAVGKTSLCVALARKFDTVVVSADSRQFYKEMNIGTAKPSLEEMNGVVHYFINNKSVVEEYNVSNYEKEALNYLRDIFKNKNCCILTGGSGLFIDAVCNGIDEMPKIPTKIRSQLNEEYEISGLSKIVEELHTKDPEYYKIVDVQNPKRVIRALEIIRFTGKPFTSFRKKNIKQRPFNVIKIGIKREREELYNRIDIRVDNMIKSGLFEEAKDLYEYKNYNALNTVGYKEIFQYFDGVYDKDEAIRLLKRNSRRYAKRQMTWFRKNEDTQWFHAEDVDRIEKFVSEKLREIE